jgi:hypothetical protein
VLLGLAVFVLSTPTVSKSTTLLASLTGAWISGSVGTLQSTASAVSGATVHFLAAFGAWAVRCCRGLLSLVGALGALSAWLSSSVLALLPSLGALPGQLFAFLAGVGGCFSRWVGRCACCLVPCSQAAIRRRAWWCCRVVMAWSSCIGILGLVLACGFGPSA